jgi:hypothetical protein
MNSDPPRGVRSEFQVDLCSGDLEVSATRENQGGDGTECDNDSTHHLHVDSLPPSREKALSHFLISSFSPQGDIAESIG